MGDKKFKIGDVEYPVTVPKGKKGRKTTNFLLARFGGGSVGEGEIFNLLEDPQFEVHLPTLLGVDAGLLETEGTTTEILGATLLIIAEMFEGFEAPEVDAALKNLPETPGAEE